MRMSSLVSRCQANLALFSCLGPGDATLGVTYVVNGELQRGCQEYVEGSGYHVDIVISEDQEASCSVSSPLLNRLFWFEAM